MEFDISNPQWIADGMIDVIMVHPVHGPIPYTAADNSGEEKMQAIWNGLMRGDYGPIAEAE